MGPGKRYKKADGTGSVQSYEELVAKGFKPFEIDNFVKNGSIVEVPETVAPKDVVEQAQPIKKKNPDGSDGSQTNSTSITNQDQGTEQSPSTTNGEANNNTIPGGTVPTQQPKVPIIAPVTPATPKPVTEDDIKAIQQSLFNNDAIKSQGIVKDAFSKTYRDVLKDRQAATIVKEIADVPNQVKKNKEEAIKDLATKKPSKPVGKIDPYQVMKGDISAFGNVTAQLLTHDNNGSPVTDPVAWITESPLRLRKYREMRLADYDNEINAINERSTEMFSSADLKKKEELQKQRDVLIQATNDYATHIAGEASKGDVKAAGKIYMGITDPHNMDKIERYEQEGNPVSPELSYRVDNAGVKVLKAKLEKDKADGVVSDDEYWTKNYFLNQRNIHALTSNPEYKKRQVGRLIGDVLSKKLSQFQKVTGAYTLSDADVQKIGLEELHLPKSIMEGVTADDVPNPTVLSTAAGTIYNKALEIGAGTGRFFGGIIGIDKDYIDSHIEQALDRGKQYGRSADADLTTGAPTTVDPNVKSDTFLQDVKNPDHGKANYKFSNVLNNISRTTADFAAFIYGMKGMTSVVSKFAPKAAALAATGGETEEAINASRMLHGAGQTAYMVASNYEQHYEDAAKVISDAAPNAELKRSVAGLMGGLIDDFVFKVLPTDKYNKAVFNGARESADRELATALREIPLEGGKGLEDIHRRVISNNIKNILEDIITPTLKEGVKLGAAMDLGHVANNIVKHVLGDNEKELKEGDKRMPDELLANLTTVPLAMMVPIGITNAMGYRANSRMFQENLYDAGLHPKEYISSFYDNVAEGKMTKEDAVKRAEVVALMKKISDAIPDISPVTGKKLTHEQRVDYAYNRFKEAGIKIQADGVKDDDPMLYQHYKDQITHFQKKREEIISKKYDLYQDNINEAVNTMKDVAEGKTTAEPVTEQTTVKEDTPGEVPSSSEAAPQETEKPTASLKTQITKADENHLSDQLGYTQDQINKMTPAEAQRIIDGGIRSGINKENVSAYGDLNDYTGKPLKEFVQNYNQVRSGLDETQRRTEISKFDDHILDVLKQQAEKNNVDINDWEAASNKFVSEVILPSGQDKNWNTPVDKIIDNIVKEFSSPKISDNERTVQSQKESTSGNGERRDSGEVGKDNRQAATENSTSPDSNKSETVGEDVVNDNSGTDTSAGKLSPVKLPPEHKKLQDAFDTLTNAEPIWKSKEGDRVADRYTGEKATIKKINSSGLSIIRRDGKNQDDKINLGASHFMPEADYDKLKALKLSKLDEQLIIQASGYQESWHNNYIRDTQLGMYGTPAEQKRYDELSKIFDPEGEYPTGYTEPAKPQPKLSTDSKTQKEKVKDVLAEGEPKSIKEIAEATDILEPNVRRILGVGAKEGEFKRLAKGVYVLTTNDGKQTAWIEAGDAVESVKSMADAGQKFDMVFLDPAYFSRALVGGNRGIKKYDFITPLEFAGLMKSVSRIVKTDDTHVYVMLSGAKTAQKDMAEYVMAVHNADFKVIGEGAFTKTFKDGKPVTTVTGNTAAPERLILFTKSGEARKGEIPASLNFRFIRPSIKTGYQTEKPKELLNALIRQSTLKGESVLDPFAGSGVTGEQAIETGRNVTLVEKNPDVVENIIKPRIETAIDNANAPVVPFASLTSFIPKNIRLQFENGSEAIITDNPANIVSGTGLKFNIGITNADGETSSHDMKEMPTVDTLQNLVNDQTNTEGSDTGRGKQNNTGKSEPTGKAEPTGAKEKTGSEKTRAKLEEQKAAFKEAVKKSRGNLTSGGLDPNVIAEGIKLLAMYAELGIKKFAEIVRDMGRDWFSDKDNVESLKMVYSAERSRLPKDQRAEYDNEDQVDDFIENELPQLLKEEEVAAPVKETPAEIPVTGSEAVQKLKRTAIDDVLSDNTLKTSVFHADDANGMMEIKKELQASLGRAILAAVKDGSVDAEMRKLKTSDVINELAPLIHEQIKGKVSVPAGAKPVVRLGRDNKEYKYVGINGDGRFVYEDDNGIRALDNGNNIFSNEPVSIIPTNEGIQFSADRRGDEYKTISEISPEPHSDFNDNDVNELSTTPETDFKNAVKEDIINGKSHNILSLRKLAAQNGLKDIKDTHLQEMVELAVVELSRNEALSDLDDEEKLNNIVDIYNKQPSLLQRSSTKIALQQYSTPAPISFIGGLYVDHINPDSVFEPSAGNGLMTIAFDPSKVTVNEIDPVRLENLSGQNFKGVMNQDATRPFPFMRTQQGVMTNPPFGASPEKVYDGYKIKGLDEQMAINALETMADNGRAAIIIGGHNTYDDRGILKSQRVFFNYLHSHYNVDDVIAINGDLYQKQGTKFNIRMILANGRKKVPSGIAPYENMVNTNVVNSFEELLHRVNLSKSIIHDNNTLLQPGLDANRGESDSLSSTRTGRSEDSEQRTSSELPPTQTGAVDTTSGEGEREPGGNDVRNVGDRNIANIGERNRVSASPDGERPIQNVDQSVPESGKGTAGDNEGAGAGDLSADKPVQSVRQFTASDLAQEKVPYIPQSAGANLNSVIPTQMASEAARVLSDIAAEHGNVDNYVLNKLGYPDKESLHKAFYAEQVDAIAMAVNQIERGDGMIIGDMTGVGKGRIAAGVIRYATLNGYQPVFMTEKVTLFSDMYRDLVGIGSGDLMPLIVNDKSADRDPTITDSDGNVVHKPQGKTEKESIYKTGIVPSKYDFVMATYSQFATAPSRPSLKRDFFRRVAVKNVVILDESHNVGGEGNIGSLFQDVLSSAKGVTYLSATFAKTPKNMPVYAVKTAMREANMSKEDLISAIEKGGVALQEVVSAQLVEAGQMIRRERNFDGVNIDYIILDQHKEKHRETADKVIGVIRQIQDFQAFHVNPVIKNMDKIAQAEQKGQMVGERKGTAQAGVDNVPFASKIFNLVHQLLFSLKAEAGADAAIEQLKAGNKPVLAFSSTMESFLRNEGFNIGDHIENPDFNAVIGRTIDTVMKYTVKDAQGNSVGLILDRTDLNPEGQVEYARLKGLVKQVSTGISFSPIDIMRHKIEQAGYTVGEITGRDMQLNFNPDGSATIVQRKNKDIKKIVRDFNNGNLDVPLLNASGATGLSMHASKDFKDQRQRVMISMQLELNIDKEVQKRGRIDRTGQLVRGAYQYVVSAIPAELRLLMMFKAKLKSLDANTTSSQKSKVSDVAVEDFLNKYGDQIVFDYLKEHPEINARLDDPLKLHDKSEADLETLPAPEGAARKVTGRVAILLTEEQEKFYNDINDRYKDYINYLESNNANDLAVKVLPLEAKSLTRSIVVQGKGGISSFGADSISERAEVNVLRKPYSKKELDHEITTSLDGRKADDISKDLVKDLNTYYENFIAEETKKIDTQYEGLRNNIYAMPNLEKEKREALLEELEAAKKLKIEKMETKNGTIASTTERRFRYFKIGGIYEIPTSLNTNAGVKTSHGVFLGFDIKAQTKNLYSPSNIKMKFAVLDSRRSIQVPTSQNDFINAIVAQSSFVSDSVKQNIMEKWDQTKANRNREERNIITGNVLQAFGNFKGQLVSYTTDKGELRKGILVNDDEDVKEKGVRIPISKAGPYIDRLNGITTNDGEVSIRPQSGGYIIEVPKSVSQGGKYFLDPTLRGLMSGKDFETYSGKMVATFGSRNLNKVLNVLQDKFGQSINVDAATAGIKEEKVKDEPVDNITPDLEAKDDTPESLDEKIKKAKKDLDDETKGQLNTGIPLNALPQLLRLAFLYAKKGIKTAAEFAKAIGAKISKELVRQWNLANQEHKDFQKNGFISPNFKKMLEPLMKGGGGKQEDKAPPKPTWDKANESFLEFSDRLSDWNNKYIPKEVNDVRDYSKRNPEFTGDPAKDRNIISGVKESMILMAKNLIKSMPKRFRNAELQEKVYHHMEDATIPLTEEEAEFRDRYVEPLQQSVRNLYEKLKGISPDMEEGMDSVLKDGIGYVPREVKGKGAAYEKAKSGLKNIFGGKLKTTSGHLNKERIFKMITDPMGNESFVILKNNNVFKGSDRGTVILGKYKKGDPDFIDKDGVKYSIRDAKVTEIEANSDTQYYKTPLANFLNTFIELKQVDMANSFIDNMKQTLQDEGIMIPIKGTVPKGFAQTTLRNFQGFAFPKDIAAELNRLAGQDQSDPLRALTTVNQFLRNSIVFGVGIKHWHNEINLWLKQGGLSRFAHPYRLAKTSMQAARALMLRTPEYYRLMERGASLMSHNVKNYPKLLLDATEAQLQRDPTIREKVASLLGYANPLRLMKALSNFSHGSAMGSHDLLMMQAVFEHMDKGHSIDESIDYVNKYIPDYDIPSSILKSENLSKILRNPNLMMFSAYHYDIFKSYGNMIRDFVKGAKDMDPKAIASAVDKMAMCALISAIVYPVLDSVAKSIFGSKDEETNRKTKVRRAGSSKLEKDVYELSTGQLGLKQFIYAYATPAQGTEFLAEVIADKNLNPYSEQAPYIQSDVTQHPLEAIKDVTKFGLEKIAPYGHAQSVIGGKKTLGDIAEDQITDVQHVSSEARKKYNLIKYERNDINEKIFRLEMRGKKEEAEKVEADYKQRLADAAENLREHGEQIRLPSTRKKKSAPDPNDFSLPDLDIEPK